MIMNGVSIKIMMRTMGKSSDYYDDSDDNGDGVGLMQPMTETMMLTGLMQPMTDVKEL